MQSLNVTLSKAIADALAAYTHAQSIASPDEVVQTALEEFLVQRGYLPPRQKRLRFTSATQGSGFRDTSVNHDAILSEQTILHKLPETSP